MMFDDSDEQFSDYDGWDDFADPYAFDDFADTRERTIPLIIPGGTTLAPAVRVGKRRRPVMMQFTVFLVVLCIVVSALFSVGTLSGEASGQNDNPFVQLALAVIAVKPSSPYHIYTALSGDTFDSIAAKFDVQINGIFELNNLYIDAYVIVGNGYKIPYDTKYGLTYQPKYRPGLNPFGHFTPIDDILVTTPDTSQFQAVAGKANPGNYCPSGSAAWGDDLSRYGFINPDQPKNGPTSVETQRFWADHDGLDLSTATYNTPLYAAQAGTVIFAENDLLSGGGYTVKIAHCNYVATSYSHLVAGSILVKVGQNVKQGQEIGLQGDTGDALGVHLHYMIFWQNIPVDPTCGYPNGIDGHTIASEGASQYNGCPPNLITLKPFAWN